MKFEYDKSIDALYIRLIESPVHRTEEIEEGTNIDFAENGNFIGIEILNARQRYSNKDLFTLSTESLALMDN